MIPRPVKSSCTGQVGCARKLARLALLVPGRSMATHALLISLAVTAVAVGVAAGAAAAPVAVDIDWGSTLMQTETGAPPLSLQPRGRNLGPLSQGFQAGRKAIRTRHINGMDVRNKRPKGSSEPLNPLSLSLPASNLIPVALSAVTTTFPSRVKFSAVKTKANYLSACFSTSRPTPVL